MGMNVCSIEGCDKTQQYLKRGWCNNHYEKWRRHGDPLADGRALYYQKSAQEALEAGEKACKKCGEVKPLSEYYVNPRGWVYTYCKTCHNLKRAAKALADRIANPPAPRTPVDHGLCAFEGCRNKGKSRLSHRGGPEGWFCTPHWIQWDRHEELKPLKKVKKSYINDKFRRCTACDEVKPQQEFHGRTGGGKQTQCKECQYLVVRASALMREGRYEEALTKARSMPVAIRERYVGKVLDAIASAGRGEEL